MRRIVGGMASWALHGTRRWFLLAVSVLLLCVPTFTKVVLGPAADTKLYPNSQVLPLPEGAITQGTSSAYRDRLFGRSLKRQGRTRKPNRGRRCPLSFHLVRCRDGTPMNGVRPAAWVTARDAAALPTRGTCETHVGARDPRHAGDRPELDLNAFYVLTLNADNTITVVDPLFTFGGTRLLALIPLPGLGEDWVMTADQSKLFVSVPAAKQVTVIDTANWSVSGKIDTGEPPTRLALQPDEHYLWAADCGSAVSNGVTVIRTDTLKAIKTIPTGKGRHEIAFDRDSQFAYVSNREDGTVSVIDVPNLVKVKDIPTGACPGSLCYTSAARLTYVVNEADGSIVGIDAKTHHVAARIQASAGITDIKFAPGGRWGFVLRPLASRVDILLRHQQDEFLTRCDGQCPTSSP